MQTQSSAVESLPDRVGIVFPKLSDVTWSLFSFSLLLNEEDIDTLLKDASFEPIAAIIMIDYVSHKGTDLPWRISVLILSGSLYLSTQRIYWIFRTSKISTSRFSQVWEGKLCWRNSTPWDKMRYKVTHTTTHTVFQIDNWAKRFLSVLSRHICEQISIICPRNFTAISWGVDLNEKLFLAKTPRSGVTNQWRTRIRPFYKPDNIATKQV